MDAKEVINNVVQRSLKRGTYMTLPISIGATKETKEVLWFKSQIKKAVGNGELDLPIELLLRPGIAFYPKKDVIEKMIEILEEAIDWENSIDLRGLTIEEFENTIGIRESIADWLRMIDLDQLEKLQQEKIDG